MEIIEKYAMFAIDMEAINEDGAPSATFCIQGTDREVKGFVRGDGTGTVRFMPCLEGNWEYTVFWGNIRKTGSFECVSNTGDNHGPVATVGMHFQYTDGTAYLPVGTTCYAWTHQTEDLQEQTLETLGKAPFNKVRMCIFPKSTPFNQNDPEHYPFLRREDGSWDVKKPDEVFWQNLEHRIYQLGELGIEADLILFHPYDRWGFARLSEEENRIYLEYCVGRLSAFRNIWWSLSNEYDLVLSKTLKDWDAFGEYLCQNDPYGHLISVHNWIEPYPKRDWMTHVSWQGSDMQTAFRLWAGYQIPVIVDELGYEGDIEFDWGNSSAFEIVNRMWTVAAFGCYFTHGETFYREDEVLWWSKGGKLYGQAPKRIAFLKEVLAGLPGPMEPLCKNVMDDPSSMGKNPEHAWFVGYIWNIKPQEVRDIFVNEFIQPVGVHPDYRLIYMQRRCQVYTDLQLPEDGGYDVEVLDVWEMTRKTLFSDVSGTVRVALPGKEGIAVLITRRYGQTLA